jgi:hypothetical protein
MAQAVQLPAGFSAQLGQQDPARVLVRGQRLGAPAGPVQRLHQLRGHPLPQRMAGDQAA